MSIKSKLKAEELLKIKEITEKIDGYKLVVSADAVKSA